MTRVSLKGICDAALEKISARARPFYFYSMLRRVNARRQNEIADLMAACSDYSFPFLNLLIFGSKASDFVRTKRRMRGLGQAELAVIEKAVPQFEAAFWSAARSYADDARASMVTEAYVRRILANPKVAAYVRVAHPKVFRDLSRLKFKCAATELTGAVAASRTAHSSTR